MKIIPDNNGAAGVYITLIVVLSMFAVAYIVNDIVLNGIRMNRSHLDSTKAYYAAESGSERILWFVRKSDPLAPFDPTTAPGWQSGYCLNFSAGNNMECNLNCDGMATSLYSSLANGSKYKIRYEFISGSPDISSFLTTGVYDDKTKRAVETKFEL